MAPFIICALLSTLAYVKSSQFLNYMINIYCKYCLSLCQRTPLHIAAGEGYVNAVEFLVDKGADVSITDDDGVGLFK